MISRLVFLGVGFVIGALRPNVGRDALKQAVKAGMGLNELTRGHTDKIKEDIVDIVAEIEHEKQARRQAAATVDVKNPQPSL